MRGRTRLSGDVRREFSGFLFLLWEQNVITEEEGGGRRSISFAGNRLRKKGGKRGRGEREEVRGEDSQG